MLFVALGEEAIEAAAREFDRDRSRKYGGRPGVGQAFPIGLQGFSYEPLLWALL